jgi:hypothetical protein
MTIRPPRISSDELAPDSSAVREPLKAQLRQSRERGAVDGGEVDEVFVLIHVEPSWSGIFRYWRRTPVHGHSPRKALAADAEPAAVAVLLRSSGIVVYAREALDLAARDQRASGNLDQADLPGLRQLVERGSSDPKQAASFSDRKRQPIIESQGHRRPHSVERPDDRSDATDRWAEKRAANCPT